MRLAVLRLAALSAIPVFGVCTRPPPPTPNQTETTERPTQQLPELVLSEARAFPLPYNQSLRGAFGPTTGSVLYWTASGAWIRQDSLDRWERLCPTQLRGLLTVGERSGSILAVDTAANVVFAVRWRGGCPPLRRLSTKPLLAAAVTDSGILTVPREADRGVELVLIPAASGEGLDVRQPAFPLPVADSSEIDWLYLAARPGGALLGYRHSPFRWVLLDPVGHPVGGVRTTNAFLRADVRGALSEGPAHRWFALDPVDLGGIFLQVLADGVTGARIARLFDSTGTLHRSRPLRAPIGFFALSSEGRLIGIRRRGFTQELAEYDWSWRRRSRL
jgi:hypothetical protein